MLASEGRNNARKPGEVILFVCFCGLAHKMTPAEKKLFDALCEQYSDVGDENDPEITPENNAQTVLDELLFDIEFGCWESHLWRSSFLGNEEELIRNICLERDVDFHPSWMTPDFKYEVKDLTQNEWMVMHTNDAGLSETLLRYKQLLLARKELQDVLKNRRLDMTIDKIRRLHDQLKSRGALDTWRRLVACEQAIKDMS
jgi:hypothetical protein